MMRGERAFLDESNPIPRVEYAFPMNSLPCSLSDVYTTAACGSWASTRCLLFIRSFLQEGLRRLGEYRSDEKLDHLRAQIRTRNMQKVLVHIIQQPSARLEVMKRALQPLSVTPALRGGDGRVGDGNLEEDGRFFLGYECLGYEF